MLFSLDRQGFNGFILAGLTALVAGCGPGIHDNSTIATAAQAGGTAAGTACISHPCIYPVAASEATARAECQRGLKSNTTYYRPDGSPFGTTDAQGVIIPTGGEEETATSSPLCAEAAL